MRVLQSLTGSVTHMDGRERPWTDRDGNARVTLAEGPLCNGVGASRGNVRWYQREAKAVTCKRCLRILETLVTEAYALHAAYMMTPEGQAQEDELAARRAEKCGQCGSERSNPRHHSAEGHAFVEAEEGGLSGMYVELSSGLTEHVEPGYRLQHKDSGERGTVTAVGPNALDLRMDDGTSRSGASWYWGRPSLPELVTELPEVGPVDRQAVLSTRVESLLHSGVPEITDAQRAAELEQEGPLSRQLREVGSGSVQCPLLYAHAVHDWFTGGSAKSVRRCAGLFEDRMPKLYTPTGEAMTVLGSAVHGGRTGLWGVREGRPLALAFFVDEDHLRLQFSAYRPGERARMADAARVATPVATPSQVAALLASMSEDAERYASGGVTGAAAQEFGASMERWTAELARWLGMSEPVKLASYASPYGGPALAEVWQARAGVQPLLCRLASSRWTTYGATCNTPLSADGTCPEAHAHV